jgi:hypothetical protein
MADDSIFLGASRKPDDTYNQAESLLLKFGNRHGLVTGATGTGKTVTLQVLAEGFSTSWSSALPISSSTLMNFPLRRSSSGIFSASRGTRSAPRFPRWARCFSRAS